MTHEFRGLVRLARSYGIQTSYYDVNGERRRASPEALMATLRVLGAQLAGPGDIRAALRQRRRELWEEVLEPVVVAWEGRTPSTLIRRPASVSTSLLCRIELEQGEAIEWRFDPGEPEESAEVGGRRYNAHRLQLPEDLPVGYHTLKVEAVEDEYRARIIAAPRRAWMPYRGGRRDWGIFAPLYALRTEESWGSGSFAELERFGDWVAGHGGRVVSTLPLLAAYLDEPYDPSPYSPVSRLFWNESYIDPARAPELESCAEARARLESASVAEEIRELRGADSVEYRRLQAARRSIIEPMARCFFENDGGDSEAFRRFLRANPLAESYARFRATVERHRGPWPLWPEREKAGDLRPGDYDEHAFRYHLYAQHLAVAQLGDVAKRYRAEGNSLYLDLPLGTRPDGFDTWQHRGIFAEGVSTGAPPDPFFSRGQSWGFPPLDPIAARREGWEYFAASIRNHVRFASMLRLDHVMGLHRLYWVPPGMDAREGVYVRYPAEELYAILCLESRRNRAVLVGEDLGTVPEAVRRGMSRHGVQRMSVLQFEVEPWKDPPVRPPERARVASINTHDMPMFAAFWRGHDIEERQAMGLLDDAQAADAHRDRDHLRGALAWSLRSRGLLGEDEHDVAAIHRAALAFLGASSARVVLVNLEDLWEETRPQNMPGTSSERPNWRRKAELGMEEFTADPRVMEQLESLRRSREGEG